MLLSNDRNKMQRVDLVIIINKSNNYVQYYFDITTYICNEVYQNNRFK